MLEVDCKYFSKICFIYFVNESFDFESLKDVIFYFDVIMSFCICIYFIDFNLINVFYIGCLNNLFWVFLLKFIEFNGFIICFS